MKTSIVKCVLMLLFVSVVQELSAQNKEFENVVEISLERTVTIKNNNSIVGYAIFYKLDKMKKAALYRLEILDENLKSIGSNEFEASKELQLIDAVYESEHIMLGFNDPKKADGYEKFVKVFDLKGKQTGLVSYDPEKAKKGMFGAAVANQMEKYYNGYNNVEGQGFVCVYQNEAKTGGADIQFITQTGKLKWEKNFTADKGDRMDLYLTSSTPNALIFFCAERANIMTKEAKVYVLGINPENGKELYRKPMEMNDYALEPMFFKTGHDGNIKMISTLTNISDKFYSANPIGFSITDFNDKTGEIKLVKNYLYDTDLGNILDMKNKSKSEDGYIRMHNICLMSDGSTVMIGEFFRRTVSAGGVAMKVLSQGRSNSAVTQVSVGDMFLLRINNKHKAIGMERIEKSVERVSLPADGLPVGLIQRTLAMDGEFGYNYTDESYDNNQRTVLVSGKLDGEKYGTSAITFNETKGYKTKKFNLDKEGKTRIFLRKAKPGHVMVMKYNPKEKKVSLSLERVD